MNDRSRKIVEVALAVLICFAAGGIGSPFGSMAIPTWYPSLEKPWFNPPNWVFAPVWSTMYTLMGISLYMVWRDRARFPASGLALALFAAQLVLNAAWAPVFFGARLLFPAFVISLLLFAAVAATIAVVIKMNRFAAALLVPYLMWLAFAGVLNYSIWRLNA